MGSFELRCDYSKFQQSHAFDFSCPHLLKTVYKSEKLPVENFAGFWKFLGWLPVNTPAEASPATVIWRSRRLEKETGIKRLYIAFNGYFPEKGANMPTCTFKELEAFATLQYWREKETRTLVVASAGNTAKAFAYASALMDIPVVIVAPLTCLCDTAVPSGKGRVKLVGLKDGDYSDAIELARKIGEAEGYVYEGGALNFVRRDSLATVLYEAVLKTGRLPDWYFQAVGSGVGAIAIWEGSHRLLVDGRFGRKLPRLHISQNEEFSPIVNAWLAGRREILPGVDYPQDREVFNRVYARVLATRYPAYSIKGGLFDALSDTRGEASAISRGEAEEAKRLFEEVEGIDILPAAAVAFASAIKASPHGHVLVNITGGGLERAKEELDLYNMETEIVVSRKTELEEVLEAIA